MHEIDFGEDFMEPVIAEDSFLSEEIEFHADFSGGGQGKAPKPPTKIQGSQHIQRQEKIRNIPRPMPRPMPKPQPPR